MANSVLLQYSHSPTRLESLAVKELSIRSANQQPPYPGYTPQPRTLHYIGHPIGPIQIYHEAGHWIKEYHIINSKSTMNASTQAKVRPWDVYFGNDDIKEDDVAFVAAANMLRLYVVGPFEFSARLREIISSGGQYWLNQKCARLMSYQMRFDRPNRDGMSDEEKAARAEVKLEPASKRLPRFPVLDDSIEPQEIDYPYDTSESTTARSSKSSKGKRKAAETESPPESPSKKIKLRLFHKKKDIEPSRILLRIDSDVHEFGTAKSKWIKLEPDWSTMHGYDHNQETEPFPVHHEPTTEEIAAWADGVISTAASNELDGFNVVPSEPKPEEIINVKPKVNKPSFRFEPSSFASRLPGFLAEMKAANEELASRDSKDHSMELPETGTTSQYIEMNLGLGVLEHVKEDSEPLLNLEKKS